MTVVDVSQLEMAGEEAKTALRALKVLGHPDSCACKLCFAARHLVSAYRRFEATKRNKGNGNGER